MNRTTVKDTIHAVDLFCGAGGTSTGLIQAATAGRKKVQLTAINHWDKAIETHKKNHPEVRHLCENIDNVNPRHLFPDGRINLLVASPECTHHSNARGGTPCSEQSRATAWRIVDWATSLYIDNILMENVKEFMSWGPLGANGLPMKSKKGQTFQAFKIALESLGYRVEHRILNSADYGDPQARERFFLIARRGNKRIRWPEPTHTENPGPDLFGLNLKKHVPVRTIIDWSIRGKSIFNRKKPLAKKTLARIEYGLRKFGGEDFIVKFFGTGKGVSIDKPLGTVTANGQHFGLCEPFITILKGQSKSRSIDKPLPTLTTKQHMYLCEPFLTRFHGGNGSEKRVHGMGAPLPVVDTSNRYGLIEPFLLPQHAGGPGELRVRSVDKPVSTIMTKGSEMLIEPFMVGIDHASAGEKHVRSLDRPAPTVITQQNYALIQAFLIKYFGKGKNARSIEKPLPAVTTKDRFGLVEIFEKTPFLDIHLRMLQPHELAAAQSFPENYEFIGNKGEVVKQIGNAVPRKIARALCRELIK